jgi:ubiquitin carboxyl-terminal hydrolase 34
MDDQQQRKRPRLDSAEAGATEASFALKEISPNGKDQFRSPSPPKLPTAVNMATSPTSKVTINTRSIQSPAQLCSQETQVSEQQSSVNDIGVAMIPEPSPGKEQDDAISISSSSSAAKSPEIQVAEVEDYDEDGSGTTWRSLSGDSTTRFGSDYVYMTFPYAKEQIKGPGRVGNIITQLSKILTDENCIEVLVKLQIWLAELLDHEDQITPDFLKSEPGFWNELPDLIGAILRRE